MIIGVGKVGLTNFTMFGSDQDNTVGCAGTVNSGSSVFQYRHAFNVSRVYTINIILSGRSGNPINNDQRGVITKCIKATYINSSTVITRLTACIGCNYSSHTASNRVRKVNSW